MATKESYFKELESIYGRLTFGDALKSFREIENKTQSNFAKKLGLSIQVLCDIEKGRIIPYPSSAAIIAQKLQLPENLFVEFAQRDAAIERRNISDQLTTASIKRLGYSVEYKEIA